MFAYRGATASRVLALIPTHTLNPHRLIWHFFRVLGHQARKLCLPDRQVIMFNKIPASLHFPLLFFLPTPLVLELFCCFGFTSVTLSPCLKNSRDPRHSIKTNIKDTLSKTGAKKVKTGYQQFWLYLEFSVFL